MKVSDLKKDPNNRNLGSVRGQAMIEESFARLGAGRSVLVDKNGVLIAGNHAADGAEAAGIEDCIVVQSDGSKLVVVQRTDLDINDDKAKLLALADNRTAEESLTWDECIATDYEDLDAGWLWRGDEIQGLFLEDEEDVDLTDEDVNGTSDDKPEKSKAKVWSLVFRTKKDMKAAQEILANSGIRCETNY